MFQPDGEICISGDQQQAYATLAALGALACATQCHVSAAVLAASTLVTDDPLNMLSAAAAAASTVACQVLPPVFTALAKALRASSTAVSAERSSCQVVDPMRVLRRDPVCGPALFAAFKAATLAWGSRTALAKLLEEPHRSRFTQLEPIVIICTTFGLHASCSGGQTMLRAGLSSGFGLADSLKMLAALLNSNTPLSVSVEGETVGYADIQAHTVSQALRIWRQGFENELHEVPNAWWGKPQLPLCVHSLMVLAAWPNCDQLGPSLYKPSNTAYISLLGSMQRLLTCLMEQCPASKDPRTPLPCEQMLVLTEVAAAVVMLHGKLIAYQALHDRKCPVTIQLGVSDLRRSLFGSLGMALQCLCACLAALKTLGQQHASGAEEAAAAAAPAPKAAPAVGAAAGSAAPRAVPILADATAAAAAAAGAAAVQPSINAQQEQQVMLRSAVRRLAASIIVVERALQEVDSSAIAGNTSTSVLSAHQAAEFFPLMAPLLEAAARLSALADDPTLCEALDGQPRDPMRARDPEIQRELDEVRDAGVDHMPWTVMVQSAVQRLATTLWTALAYAAAATPEEQAAGLPDEFPPPATLQRLAHSVAKLARDYSIMRSQSVLGMAALLSLARDLQPGLSQQDLLRAHAGAAWVLTPVAMRIVQHPSLTDYGPQCMGGFDALLTLASAGLGDIVARQGAGALLHLPLTCSELSLFERMCCLKRLATAARKSAGLCVGLGHAGFLSWLAGAAATFATNAAHIQQDRGAYLVASLAAVEAVCSTLDEQQGSTYGKALAEVMGVQPGAFHELSFKVSVQPPGAASAARRPGSADWKAAKDRAVQLSMSKARSKGLWEKVAFTVVHQLEQQCRELFEEGIQEPNCVLRDIAVGRWAGVGCCNPACTNVAGWSEQALVLRKCSACQVVRYCSAACQRDDWLSHRPACKELRRQLEG